MSKFLDTFQPSRKPAGGRRARSPLTGALLLGLAAAASLLLVPAASAATTTYQCVGGVTQLFNNWNGDAVSNGGTPATFSTDGQPLCLVSISTYHWNNGYGQTPGTIGLLSETGSLGPFTATGSVGSPSEIYPEGVPNANWTVTRGSSSKPVIINGTYACEDSDPASWSQDAASGGAGFCKVFVQQAKAVTPPPPPPPTTTPPPTTPPTYTNPSPGTTDTGSPVVPPGTTPSDVQPGIDCHCAQLGVKVLRVITNANSNDPAQAVVAVELKWSLACTGGSRFHHCTGDLVVNKPAGSQMTQLSSFFDTVARDRTGKLRHVEVVKPTRNPVSCDGQCTAGPSTHSGLLRVRFVLNRSGDDVLQNGVQFSVSTTCENNKNTHKLDLQFKGPFGDLDRKLSILS